MVEKRILTPKFRVSYPQVFEPRSFAAGQEAVYSITMLFPKSTDLSALRGAAKKAAQEKWGDQIPRGLKSPFRDGDTDDTISGYDGYAGMIAVRATSRFKPQIVDQDLNDIIDQKEFYPGCWARATLLAFAYSNVGKGVSFGLQNIQKLDDDENLAGRRSAYEDFSESETDSDLAF